MEELPASRRRDVMADVDGAGGFAEDRHLLRIPAEGGDVRSDPLERRTLIEQPLVSREGVARILARKRDMAEEPEDAQAVVDRDHHDVVLLDEHVAVVDVARDVRERHDVGRRPGHVRTAVEPHHDRSRLRRRRIGRPDVQVETVLALARATL
jgi:hypothetical protein